MPTKSKVPLNKEYIIRISIGNLKNIAVIRLKAPSIKEAEALTMKFLKVKASLT